MTTDRQVQEMLDKLTVEQRAVAKTLATLKVENRMLKAQNEALSKEHGELWRILVVIMHHYREAFRLDELRIHSSQFLRFSDMYRIDRSYDEATEEVVLRLLMLNDPVPGAEDEGESVH